MRGEPPDRLLARPRSPETPSGAALNVVIREALASPGGPDRVPRESQRHGPTRPLPPELAAQQGHEGPNPASQAGRPWSSTRRRGTTASALLTDGARMTTVKEAVSAEMCRHVGGFLAKGSRHVLPGCGRREPI